MKNFIIPEQLSQHMHRVGIYAGATDGEQEAYSRCHLPGSYFLHLEDDLTGDATTGKGRHPLPEMNTFADRIMALGVSRNTPVLLYSEGLSMAAYRLWWMLKAVGVQDVKYLYDPDSQWKEHCTDKPTPLPESAAIDLAFDPRSMMEMSEVRREIQKEAVTLIDSRDAERYLGIKDEYDHRPGHIPTAHSYPYEALQGDTPPDPERIRNHFEALPTGKPVVVYCGSGVSAPFNIMLLDEIGIGSTLYPGSFSGWIEDPENEIEKQ